MPENKNHILIYGRIIFGLFVLFGVYLTRFQSDILFHGLIIGLELFLAAGIFTAGWNSRRLPGHSYFLVLGTGWLFIGLLKLLFLLSLDNAEITVWSSPFLPALLAGAALYLEAVCLLAAPFYIRRSLNPYLVFSIFSAIFLAVLAAVFIWPVFPGGMVESSGRHMFQRISEIGTIAVIAASLVVLYRRGQGFPPDIRRPLKAGVILDLATETLFFLYSDSPAAAVPLIHFLKIISWYLLYRAVTRSFLSIPPDHFTAGGEREPDNMMKSKDLTREFFSQIPAMMHSLDKNGHLLDVSNHWLENMGYTREEVIGRSLLDFFTPPSRRYAQEVVWPSFLQNGEVSDIPYQMIKKNKEVIDVSISAAAYKDAEGNLIRSMAVVNDITSSKKAESQIKEARSSALAASLSKGLFLGKLSYEIRTPMNSIIGMTSLALDTELDNEQREYLEAVKTSSLHLLGVFNDIFDLSRIESGALELENEPFRLRENLTAIVRTQTTKARDKGLELTCTIDPQVPDQLVGDAGRLNQVVLNLLQNSIKFSDEGEISISVQADRLEENNVILQFRVTDTGLGIPRERRRIIFDPFFQINASPDRRHGNAGLGLALSKQLVRLMGGDISLESVQDMGSVFDFTVRFKRCPDSLTGFPEGPSAGDRAPGPIEKMRILLAEDNPVNSKLAIRILEKKGHTVIPVNNGLEALKALDENEYDLLLMDIQMPGMDGLEAAAAIREKEKQTGGRLPIVAMTAYAMKKDKELCFQAGMDEYVTKPINDQNLFRAIYSVIGSGQMTPAAGRAANDRTDVFDYRSALARWGDDLPLLMKLIGIFLTDLPKRTSDIQEAIRLDNAPMIKRAAHSLKGASSSLSAVRLTDALLNLENCAKSGDLEQADELFEQVEFEIEKLKTVLDGFIRDKAPD